MVTNVIKGHNSLQIKSVNLTTTASKVWNIHAHLEPSGQQQVWHHLKNVYNAPLEKSVRISVAITKTVCLVITVQEAFPLTKYQVLAQQVLHAPLFALLALTALRVVQTQYYVPQVIFKNIKVNLAVSYVQLGDIVKIVGQ